MEHLHCKEGHCPVTATIQLIGGKYKPIILWYLSHRTMRFGELKSVIPQVTVKMLTQQLRSLEKDKLITRKIYPVVPPKVEYTLTEFGKSIGKIMQEMYN
jgi:DNA-binding HxlR family transcriptional regulator